VCVCVHNEFESCVTCYSEKYCLLICRLSQIYSNIFYKTGCGS